MRRLLLQWLTTRGPFIDDDRQAEPDDFFEFEGKDVTDQGLGEAARRVKYSESAGVFSFQSQAIDFARTPLQVDHGLPEERYGSYDIPNVWELKELERKARDILPAPTTWDELIGLCRQMFDRVWIADYVLTELGRETFYPNVANRTLALLGVLQEVMEERNPQNGKFSAAAMAQWQRHTTGDEAWFTDESRSNKAEFEGALTFPDPSDLSRSLFCSMHGKIKTPQFRIHFEWPVPVGQEHLKVVYIGPKRTKN